MIGVNRRGDTPNSYVRECITSLEAAEAEQQASTLSPLAQVCQPAYLFAYHENGRCLKAVL